MKSFTDQMGRTIAIPFPPQRIVSIVPSQTELLFHLGLGQQVVGLTKFCVHPPHARQLKTIVGGTKKLHLDKIGALQPDLVIGNKEENQQEQIEALAQQFPVWMSDIITFEDGLNMIKQIGQITDKATPALQLIKQIQHAFTPLSENNTSPIEVAYLIWRKPYMVAASQTFINELLLKAGFINVFAHEQRYPEKTPDQLYQANPDVLFLSSEPYPFKDKHLAELQAICPNATIKLVDGELFSWYGSRLLHAARYFVNLRGEVST